jgi:hypothetical protein
MQGNRDWHLKRMLFYETQVLLAFIGVTELFLWARFSLLTWPSTYTGVA